MDRPDGQAVEARSADSTRRRLLVAAAELIAEVGWGRVTTRAVAERAALPHGAVSYHFRGKQSMLVAAAVAEVEAMFPDAALESMASVDELFEWTRTAVSEAGAGAVQAGVLLEAMRESSRDPQLREQIAAVLHRVRERVAELVLSAGETDLRPPEIPAPAAVATVLVAAGDGLWLHCLLDPDLDVSEAVAAIRALTVRGMR